MPSILQQLQTKWVSEIAAIHKRHDQEKATLHRQHIKEMVEQGKSAKLKVNQLREKANLVKRQKIEKSELEITHENEFQQFRKDKPQRDRLKALEEQGMNDEQNLKRAIEAAGWQERKEEDQKYRDEQRTPIQKLKDKVKPTIEPIIRKFKKDLDRS